jgi:hypothetical protein
MPVQIPRGSAAASRAGVIAPSNDSFEGRKIYIYTGVYIYLLKQAHVEKIKSLAAYVHAKWK